MAKSNRKKEVPGWNGFGKEKVMSHANVGSDKYGLQSSKAQTQILKALNFSRAFLSQIPLHSMGAEEFGFSECRNACVILISAVSVIAMVTIAAVSTTISAAMVASSTAAVPVILI